MAIKLSDYGEQKFLENFIEFGSMHRARVAYGYLQQFKRLRREDETSRGSLALEILQTYLNSFEDVGIWLTVLPKWLAAKAGLVELLGSSAKRHEREPRMKPKYSVQEQLTFHAGYSMPDAIARKLGLPYLDHQFDALGIPEQRRQPFRSELRELSRLSNVFFWEAERTTPRLDCPGAEPRKDETGAIYLDLAVWRILNRLKHGLLVTLAHDGSTNVYVHTNPEDFEECWGVRVNYHSLVKLVSVTFMGCLFLGRVLSLAYQSRYRAAPQVSWLAESFRLNLRRIDPYQIRRLLTHSRVGPAYHLTPRLSASARFIEPPVFGQLSGNWWRGQRE